MQVNNPQISVIVPCYNYARYLPDLLGSLKSQSFPDWECILVDDGSIDDTKAVAAACLKEDPRIKYIYQSNSGPAAARINGLKEAKGKYIQFIDADDFIGTDKFKIELELFAQNISLDIVYSGYTFIDENKKQWIDEKKWQALSSKPFNDFVKYWEAGLMIPIHSFLFSRKCFDRWGGFDGQFKTHEDWDLHLNLSLKGACYLYHDYSGAYYRIHNSSSSRTDLTKNRKDTTGVLLKYFKSDDCSFSQKMMIAVRYCRFTADFFAERVLHKRIRFFESLNMKSAGLLGLIALLLLPFFLTIKSFQKITGK